MEMLILVLMAAVLLTAGCEKKEARKEESRAASAQKLVIEKADRTAWEETEIEQMREELPASAEVETEPILQKPELPTGCESVALTMALGAWGYDLEKTEIAKQYLVYSSENFAAGYVGDPGEYSGMGIFPPGLTETANRFLEQRYQQQTAYDVSGMGFRELFAYIAAGDPVLLWVTLEMEEPYYSDQIAEYAGKTYRWYWNEHCVMLGGYDLEKDTVIIYDPLEGKREDSLTKVQEIYNQCGQYAVVIY